MNPIWRQMKKCSPSSGWNSQLVHWWLLVHFGHGEPPNNNNCLLPPCNKSLNGYICVYPLPPYNSYTTAILASDAYQFAVG